MNQHDKEVFQRAIADLGIKSQSDMLVEECLELALAVRHYDRDKVNHEKLLDELVDVSVMIEQMKLIINNYSLFNKIWDEKVKRLDDRLKNGHLKKKYEVK
jgi:NTP pyrophosphatase (non-canonical NTP hydrolase)